MRDERSIQNRASRHMDAAILVSSGHLFLGLGLSFASSFKSASTCGDYMNHCSHIHSLSSLGVPSMMRGAVIGVIMQVLSAPAQV